MNADPLAEFRAEFVTIDSASVDIEDGAANVLARLSLSIENGRRELVIDWPDRPNARKVVPL